jgi:hypothetical protein
MVMVPMATAMAAAGGGRGPSAGVAGGGGFAAVFASVVLGEELSEFEAKTIAAEFLHLKYKHN